MYVCICIYIYIYVCVSLREIEKGAFEKRRVESFREHDTHTARGRLLINYNTVTNFILDIIINQLIGKCLLASESFREHDYAYRLDILLVFSLLFVLLLLLLRLLLLPLNKRLSLLLTLLIIIIMAIMMRITIVFIIIVMKIIMIIIIIMLSASMIRIPPRRETKLFIA